MRHRTSWSTTVAAWFVKSRDHNTTMENGKWKMENESGLSKRYLRDIIGSYSYYGCIRNTNINRISIEHQ